MATMITESDRFGASAEGRAAAAAAAAVQQPSPDSVLAEVSVVVHASRRAAAPAEAGQAQTVREETSTIIVFSQGAVLALSSQLSRGDLVVLNNRQNRADMLCRVVYVREQPDGPSYVELEFTQRATGFWTQAPVDSSPSLGAHRTAAPLTPASSLPEIARPPVSLVSSVTEPTSRPVTHVAAAPPVAAAPIAAATAPAPAPAAPVATATAPAPTATVPFSAPLEPILAHTLTDSALTSQPADDSSQATAVSEPTASTTPEQFLPAESPEPESEQRSLWQGVVAKLKAWSHHPMMWVACAAFTLLAFLADGYFLGHRVPSSSPAEVNTTRAAYPVQPASVRANDALSFGGPHAVLSDSGAATLPAGAENSSAASPATSTSKADAAPDASATAADEAQPRRNALRIGKLAAPIARRPASAPPSEPPPVLSAPGTTVVENLTGVGPFVNTAAPGGAVPSVPAANAPVHAATGYQGPKLLSSAAPVYPAIARSEGMVGVVVVDATIDPSGTVTAATVVSGPNLLRQAALDAVRKWKYQPAESNGEPVPSHQTVNVNFTHQ